MTPGPLYIFFPQHHTASHGFPEIELESRMTHNPPHHKVISEISGLKKTEGRQAGDLPLPQMLGSPLQSLPRILFSPKHGQGQTDSSLLLGKVDKLEEAHGASALAPRHMHGEAQTKGMLPPITFEHHVARWSGQFSRQLPQTPRPHGAAPRENAARAQSVQARSFIKRLGASNSARTRSTPSRLACHNEM